MYDGTSAFLLSLILLLVAAGLSSAQYRQRRLALMIGVGATVMPWLAPPDLPLLRGGLAIWTTWCCGRVADLTSESRGRSFGRCVWHVFGLVDTRRTTLVSPAVDWQAVGKTLAYAAAAIVGLFVVTHVAPLWQGSLYWGLRWFGGALFFYCLADAVEGGVRTLYRVAGVAVPRQHVLPIVSRSVQEFWGKRWNRAVGSWLRAHCFLPFAREGKIRAGLVAAFAASAVFHAYFTLVAVGWAMAGAMLLFFIIQGWVVLCELQMGVTHWRPALAHAWTVVAVLGCSPLFVEPILRILEYTPG